MEKHQTASVLCSNCKQFYGNATTNYLCSSCFKKTSSETANAKQATAKQMKSQTQSKQTDPTRCHKCKKNVGLLGINCKCDYIFCNKHRMPQDHDCEVDYRKIGKEQLKKQYEVVAPSKLEQI